MPSVGSRFSRDTTVAELTEWWRDSVARHQVKTSTMNYRKVCCQAFTEAVKFRLIPANPFDLVPAPRVKRVKAGRALSPADAKSLIAASQELRLGAAVTLLFCQGWRVSEVLGLAWEDLDLDAGAAQIRRGASYSSSVGMILGSTKTSVAEGLHHLAPASVARLRVRHDEQKLERHAMDGRLQALGSRRFGASVSTPFTNSSSANRSLKQALWGNVLLGGWGESFLGCVFALQ